MAGGFADVNPVDMARVFLAADDQRYKRGVDMADRQSKFLDAEAQRIQSTWDQVAQELADGTDKNIAAYAAANGVSFDAAKGDARIAKEAQNKYIKDNFQRLAPVLNGVVTSPLVKDEFKRAFGAHRDLAGFDVEDDGTGNLRFAIRVDNAKTGTNGRLDNTADGVDTSKDPSAQVRYMEPADFINNMASLSDVAVLRRGGFTTGARHLAGNTAAEASNRALEESRAGLREQNRLAAEGASQISADGSKLHLLGTDAVATTPASPSGSVSVSGSGSGAAVVPPQAPVPPQSPVSGVNAGSAAPESGGLTINNPITDAYNAVIKPVVEDTARYDVSQVRKHGNEWLRGEGRYSGDNAFGGPYGAEKSAAGLKKRIIAGYKDGTLTSAAGGALDTFVDSLRKFEFGPDGKVVEDLPAPIRAEIKRRLGEPARTTAVDRSIAVGDKLAADTPLPPAASGTVSAYQTGNATPEETAKVLSRTFNGKISAGAIEKVLNAATDTRLLGAKQAKWTLNEARAIGLLQRYGVITPEQAAGMRTPAKAVAEGQAKDIEGVAGHAFAAKAPQVDTTIARTAMDNAAAEQRTRMTLIAQLGKERTDKFLDNEEKSLKELFTQPEKESGVEQKVRYLYRNTAPFAIAAGYDLAGSQTDASQYGQQMKQFYARLNATNPGLIRRFFGAQGVDFLNSSGAKFINAVVPEATRTPQAVANALPAFRAAAQAGGLSSDASAALARGNEGEAFRLWAQDEAIRDLEATLGEE